MAGRALGGVPETALWTLRNRAAEAARPDSYLHDPEAVRLYRTLRAEHAEDFDRFGKPSQSHPLRALVVDDTIQSFLCERADLMNRLQQIAALSAIQTKLLE